MGQASGGGPQELLWHDGEAHVQQQAEHQGHRQRVGENFIIQIRNFRETMLPFFLDWKWPSQWTATTFYWKWTSAPSEFFRKFIQINPASQRRPSIKIRYPNVLIFTCPMAQLYQTEQTQQIVRVHMQLSCFSFNRLRQATLRRAALTSEETRRMVRRTTTRRTCTRRLLPGWREPLECRRSTKWCTGKTVLLFAACREKCYTVTGSSNIVILNICAE